MTDRWKNIFIGLFISTALGIATAFILFLKPTIGDGKKKLYVRFSNIAGVNSGTRVTYAGKPVGEVTDIEEVPNARLDPSSLSGRVYSFQLTLQIDSKTDVYDTDEIAVRTTGLMGEKSIAILPKAPSLKKTAHLIGEQVLYADSVDPIENAFNLIGQVDMKAEDALDSFGQWLESNQVAFLETAQTIAGTCRSLQQILRSFEETNIVLSLEESLTLLTENMRAIHATLVEDNLLGHLNHLIDSLNIATSGFNSDGLTFLENLNKISSDIAKGSGTIARCIQGDDLYLHVNSIVSKANTLMNDINHYGILFQYDKHWQRSRMKKANLLKTLDSPHQFKNYFEKEMDSISTSLGRITELLNKAHQHPEQEKIASQGKFRKDFAFLLRQVESLSDTIKLYNQELLTQWDED